MLIHVLQDVFILDTKKEVFVWIGHGTTTNERKNAMTYAHVSNNLVYLTYSLHICSRQRYYNIIF
jgi:hypothetical protein